MHRSNSKLDIEDMHHALQNNEKLGQLPDTIETNVIYRLSLASNTKGESQCSHESIK
ncbi:unnamed protein product, partial [Didymodactylos carnosus]